MSRSRCELLVHMVKEYARHDGHADLLHERIDGASVSGTLDGHSGWFPADSRDAAFRRAETAHQTPPA